MAWQPLAGQPVGRKSGAHASVVMHHLKVMAGRPRHNTKGSAGETQGPDHLSNPLGRGDRRRDRNNHGHVAMGMCEEKIVRAGVRHGDQPER